MSTRQQEVILASEAPAAPSFSFQEMQRMAVAVAKSGLFGVKEPDQALSLMLVAQAEGKHPALIARDYDIIQGRPAKKSEAILRDFQASGGRIQWHEMSDTLASATFSHPFSGAPLKVDWDINRAKKAGLIGKPGGMYEKYPRQMLRARVISEGCRAVAPSTTSGFYTPEEVRDFTQEQLPAQSMTSAIDDATSAPEQSEIEARINSMDVADIKSLEETFASAWRSTKHKPTRDKYKATYDEMKANIEEAAQRTVAEPQ